jgi:predicted nucleic acid-binding Zn finger protein
MQIKKFGDHYKVKSESSNRWYEVFPDRPFCTCPNFVFRSVKGGGVCKHIVAVQEKIGRGAEDILEYVSKKGEIDAVELVEKFGEEKVKALKEIGELIEEAGRIRVLR